MNPIVGWDLFKGSGAAAVELRGRAKPKAFKLFEVLQAPGELPGVPTSGYLYAATPYQPEVPAVAQIDVFNLDPRLTLALIVHHQEMQARPAGSLFPESNLAGAISARPLVKSENPSEADRELYTLPTESLFGNGGAISDGCEVTSAMSGIRFRIDVTMAALYVHHDIVATLVAIPNVTLACPELARAIIARLDVRIPAPLPFWAYTFT